MAQTRSKARVSGQSPWPARLLILCLLIIFGTGIWFAAHHRAVKVVPEEVSTIVPVAPPPPPPPPPPPKEVTKETEQPAPTAAPTPQSDRITENAPAQDSPDAFQIGAGTGEGTRGSGVPGSLERTTFSAYLAGVIKEAIKANPDLRNKSFRIAVSVWISPAGQITRVELRSSTGSKAVDQELQALLSTLPQLDQLPPQAVLDALPVQMTIDLRKSL